MTDAGRVEKIRDLLMRSLSPDHLEVIDQSHKHAGHEGAKSGKGHFDIIVVSSSFRSKSLLERHRMIYDALGDAMESDIHALGIRASTPDED